MGLTEKSGPEEWPEIEIDSLSHDGRGVGRSDKGKVVFVDYALPGERVRYRQTRSRRNFSNGTTIEVLRGSPDRVSPRCSVFGTCGGCIFQHCDHAAQVSAKQLQLLENLEKIGAVLPENILTPLQAEEWGYRRKARLGIRDVAKKGGILVGFRERNKSYVTPIKECDVLHPAASSLLEELQRTVSELSCRNQVPQIEVAVADNATALVFRHLETFNGQDLALLRGFAERHEVQVYLQPGNLDSIHPLWPDHPEPLYYRLDKFDIELFFRPTDFIQINGPVNNMLVDQVVDALDLTPGDDVLDLFCGLGNFSLPLATRAGKVVGIEGDAGLVDRARLNQVHNGINNAEFVAMDLFEETAWTGSKFDKVLIDPPRTGALNVIRNINSIQPDRLVYVSCNPATLARDAGQLVNEFGYRLRSAGIIDMFPHTAHVETMAVFESA